jgi:hypothetical protein
VSPATASPGSLLSPPEPPSAAVYYDDLDTTRFANAVSDSERKARDVTSMGMLMAGLLVGDVAPVFSYAQAHDCQPLLALVSPERGAADGADRLAFLQLVRAGFVRVGFTPGSVDGGDYSLLNVLRKSLANPGFVLSGWPEVNADPELRAEIVGQLDRSPEAALSGDVPDGVAARVEGLRAFDRNLRQSPTGVQLVSPAGGAPLDARVREMLPPAELTGAEPVVGEAVLGEAAAAVIERALADGTNLASRSGWYRQIDWHLANADPAGFEMLRQLVDLNYSAMVSETLSGDGLSLSVESDVVAGTAAHELTPGETPGARWAELSTTPASQEWLRWSDVPALLAELTVLTPRERLRELEQRRGLWIAEYEATRSWGGSLRIALPSALGVAISGFGTSVVTGAAPHQAAGAAALTGVATLVAGTPAVKAFQQRLISHREERLRARDERSAIRTGAASWLERMATAR